MLTECPPRSQTDAERSNPQGEAPSGEPVSRNTSELDSASLHKLGAATLSEMPKPAMVGEATFEGIQPAPRGDWRQRAGKDSLRNLGGPFAELVSVRESEGLIVVRKRGNARGAKGSCCRRETIGRGRAA